MISRSQFAEKFLKLRGKPFSLKGYEYLLPVYEDRVKGRRILLKTARQIAKCCSEDTEVTLSNGNVVKIKDLKAGDGVCCLNNSTLKAEAGKVLEIHENGVQECYKIKTKYLRNELICTLNHPLKTLYGYRLLAQLKPGDFVGISRRSPHSKGLKLTLEYNLTKKKFKNYVDFFNDSFLTSLLNSDILWDQIESIEPVGEKQTYNLETSHKNFVANGVITHNSQTICNVSQIDCFQISNFDNLYITFTQKQMLAFARQKIDPLLAESRKIRDYFLAGPYIRDSITDKRYSNNSTTFLRHCYLTADSVRGISADRICVDECQLILTDNIPIIEECVSHSNYKWMLYAGTPTSEDSSLEDLWDNSTQNEWLLKCPHCGNFNYQDIDIIKEEGLQCRKCKRIMDRDQLTGQYFCFQPDAPIVSYRFTQLTVPWMTHAEIMYKIKNYSTQKFYNEVLALPFNVSEKALSKDDILKNMTSHPNTVEFAKKFAQLPLVAGIDWGGGSDSYTVLSVGYHQHGVTKIIYSKKFIGAEADPVSQIDILADICVELKVRLVLADFGMGLTSNPLLAQKLAKYGIGLYPIMYTAQKETLSWQPIAVRYQANKTVSLGRLFSDMKQGGKIEFPKYEPELYKDFLNVRTQKRLLSGSSVIFYDHRRDEPDDLVQSVNYVHLGAPLIHPYFQ